MTPEQEQFLRDFYDAYNAAMGEPDPRSFEDSFGKDPKDKQNAINLAQLMLDRGWKK